MARELTPEEEEQGWRKLAETLEENRNDDSFERMQTTLLDYAKDH